MQTNKENCCRQTGVYAHRSTSWLSHPTLGLMTRSHSLTPSVSHTLTASVKHMIYWERWLRYVAETTTLSRSLNSLGIYAIDIRDLVQIPPILFWLQFVDSSRRIFRFPSSVKTCYAVRVVQCFVFPQARDITPVKLGSRQRSKRWGYVRVSDVCLHWPQPKETEKKSSQNLVCY